MLQLFDSVQRDGSVFNQVKEGLEAFVQIPEAYSTTEQGDLPFMLTHAG